MLLKNKAPRRKNVQDFVQNPYTTEQFVQISLLKGIKHTQTEHEAGSVLTIRTNTTATHNPLALTNKRKFAQRPTSKNKKVR